MPPQSITLQQINLHYVGAQIHPPLGHNTNPSRQHMGLFIVHVVNLQKCYKLQGLLLQTSHFNLLQCAHNAFRLQTWTIYAKLKKNQNNYNSSKLAKLQVPQVGWEHIRGDYIVILSKLARYELLAMEQKNNE
jgi:hypothetical protein